MSNGVNQIGIPKFQQPWRTLQVNRSSGTWGDRGSGNELQSALEKGLSCIVDKIVNMEDYIGDGFNYLTVAPMAFITGKTEEINNIKSRIQKAKKVEQRWLNGEITYDLDLERILDRYAEFPKMFNKLFKGKEVRTVTDPKGNTWYEVDIPEDFLNQEWQFKKAARLELIM